MVAYADYCEKCGAETTDIGSKEDSELGWDYCPNCNNPHPEVNKRFDEDPYEGTKCSTCVIEMGRAEPKDARFEGQQYYQTGTQLFCYDCVEIFAKTRTIRRL